MEITEDLRIRNIDPLISPVLLEKQLPLGDAEAATVSNARKAAADILHGRDDRLLTVVGPCSIHDPAAALDYAARLKEVIPQYQDDLLIMMRVYFEKPRTTVGWKGLVNDPDLNGSFEINKGLKIGRKLLLDLAAMGIPSATEFLDTITPQYIADLVAWGAIGARTTESQIHRQLASGLSMPVGFKNGTGGSCQIAVDAIQAAQGAHHFLGATNQGLCAIVETSGNEDCHLILRGSSAGPNYDAASVADAVELLTKTGLDPQLMIDCSHGNSLKKHENQPRVAAEVGEQIAAGNEAIAAVMIESNLVEGNQKLTDDPSQLTYGQSITDACINWDTTLEVFDTLAQSVRARRG
ncbi:3-deoxy-7-phosphoheptulonate synthase [Sulfuriroseicoccus oceanibius]|uniref:Phospho-2-dehydro-3-deoxyheptonate aldolase n=1 Tax=Sulfuriroseicoccus oceanibius TaxID=2707525 RepID=A0A6B3L472_9BACT|nr:3-deoxy-7-phosphoheptulonate synthase [Sulfuriroseicoccus oceanibius]QQL44881.1 3-deoxy-7-phosphoheptulonate synthase [Sulfuriroseicoccus oceanibius]